MARPKLDIDERTVEGFAKQALLYISGEKSIPAFIDPVKNLKKLIQSMPKEDRLFWVGTPFYHKQSLDCRLKTAVREWTRGHASSLECPFEFCGFSLDELRADLESKFEPWMCWSNWGQWHVDHIIPRCLYLKPYSKTEIFGLDNIRPVHRMLNYKKGRKLNG